MSRDNKAIEKNVCKTAFYSLRGIGRGKLENLLTSLKKSADPPKDNRGKHKIRPNAISAETKNMIIDHITSLKGRESQYRLKDSRKIHLPEELNITKYFICLRRKILGSRILYMKLTDKYSTTTST